MKRVFAIILSLLILTGCTTPSVDNEKLTIVTTIFPQYDFVREIGKEKVNVRMLLKPGEETHSYEPTPQDIKAIQNCDLFIYVGGENDTWVESILSSMKVKPQTLKLVDMVSTVNEESVEGMQEGRGEEEEEIDEHVWTSPKNCIKIVKKISAVMIQKDQGNKEYYHQNTLNYIKELKKIDQQFKDVVDHSLRKTIIFGDRFPFRYLCDDYGIKYYAAFPGCSSDNEVSAATLAFLIDKVKSEKIPIVFSIELSSEKIAQAICEETGAKNLIFYSYHNITSDQMKEGISYLNLAKKNIESLKIALN